MHVDWDLEGAKDDVWSVLKRRVERGSITDRQAAAAYRAACVALDNAAGEVNKEELAR